MTLCAGVLTPFREVLTHRTRLTGKLAACSFTVSIVHLPLVVTVRFCLADRGLSAVGAWAVVCVLVLPAAFPWAGLRRLPGLRRVL